MTATTTPPATPATVRPAPAAPEVKERAELRNVLVVARKELRDAVRDRWFWLYAGGFTILAVALSSFAISEARVVGFGGFGRTAASLVALVQLVVPLMGLTLGARSIASQRERGTLAFLLAHPVSRSEAFLGIFLGSTTAMLAAVAGGFGIAGLVAAIRSATVVASDLVEIALLSWLLAVAMIGVGMLVSVTARRSSAAMGTALFVWLLLVFLGDVGLMGTAVATRLPVNALFFTAVANPVEAFRLSTITALEGSLDVLGPVGSYAVERLGDALRWVVGGIVVVWAVVPTVIAWALFRRGRDL